MLCKICVVQIQPRKHVRDHADFAAPTRQHELYHTTSGIYLPCMADLHHEVGIDYLYDTDHLYDLCSVLSGHIFLFGHSEEGSTQHMGADLQLLHLPARQKNHGKPG